MLNKSDLVVIQIALGTQMEKYEKLLEQASETVRGAFRMAQAMTEGVLEKVNSELAQNKVDAIYPLVCKEEDNV